MKLYINKLFTIGFSIIFINQLFASSNAPQANAQAHVKLKTFEYLTIAQLLHDKGVIPSDQHETIKEQFKTKPLGQALAHFHETLEHTMNRGNQGHE